LNSLDPADVPADAEGLSFKAQLIPAVFETLVRFDDNGNPQPWLATSWTHDASRKRWVFTIRPKVRLHSGALWLPPGGVIEISDEKPLPRILSELARPWNAIVVREPDGSLSGTGPFRVARWDARRGAQLVANDAYWNGRPYIDTVEIQMGRDARDQAQAFQLGRADVTDGVVGSSAGRPDTVIALLFDEGRTSPAAREAVALSIDRTAIRRVLLKDRGEISGALLPQWLSGYAFLFAPSRDLDRAKQLAGAASSLAFGYDRQDPVMRSIAERISVNAMEAGIAMRPGNGAIDVRLAALPVTSPDQWTVLGDLATLLKTSLPSSTQPYDSEKALLGGFRVVPLFHVTRGWNASAKLEGWPQLADVWIRKP
jgi:ABC-type transport system substrate-binding protein